MRFNLDGGEYLYFNDLEGNGNIMARTQKRSLEHLADPVDTLYVSDGVYSYVFEIGEGDIITTCIVGYTYP